MEGCRIRNERFYYTTASIKLESWKAILFILENKNYHKMSEHMSLMASKMHNSLDIKFSVSFNIYVSNS